MGSYDGAETCELIGVYMLSLIAPKFKDEVGLYRFGPWKRVIPELKNLDDDI